MRVDGHLIDRPLTLDLLGICRTSIMRIDLFRRCVLVQGDEPMKQVFTSRIVVVATVVVREVVRREIIEIPRTVKGRLFDVSILQAVHAPEFSVPFGANG